MAQLLDVLFEDNHLLVINKPAGLATMGVAEGRESVLTRAKEYVRRKYHKPGNVYLGVVSRLDAPVTGVLVIARTSKAASRLTASFRAGEVDKNYWAVTRAAPDPAEGRCIDLVRKDERHRKMHVTRQERDDAKEARLTYRTRCAVRGGWLVEVKLETGRKHQIRLQLSHRQWPIVGDRKYGSEVAFPQGIALHARSIAFQHPVRKTALQVEAPLPATWDRFGIDPS